MAYLELLCDFEIFDSLEIKNTTRTNEISCKNIFDDKIAIFIITPIINSSYNEELFEVLESLGYKKDEIKKVVNEVPKDLTIEMQVKEALKLLLK